MKNSRLENTFSPRQPRKSTSVQTTPDVVLCFFLSFFMTNVSLNLQNMSACILNWSDWGDIYNRPPILYSNYPSLSMQF